jgi:hypothetical protein
LQVRIIGEKRFASGAALAAHNPVITRRQVFGVKADTLQRAPRRVGDLLKVSKRSVPRRPDHRIRAVIPGPRFFLRVVASHYDYVERRRDGQERVSPLLRQIRKRGAHQVSAPRGIERFCEDFSDEE